MDPRRKETAVTPTHVVAVEVAAETETGGGYPEPFQSRMGKAHWRRLGEVFGLTRFGFNLETREPGAPTPRIRTEDRIDSGVRSRAGDCARQPA